MVEIINVVESREGIRAKQFGNLSLEASELQLIQPHHVPSGQSLVPNRHSIVQFSAIISYGFEGWRIGMSMIKQTEFTVISAIAISNWNSFTGQLIFTKHVLDELKLNVWIEKKV